MRCIRLERQVAEFVDEQKLEVLSEATAPGANLSEVARRHGVLPAQVYKWRRLAELGVIGVPGASEHGSCPRCRGRSRMRSQRRRAVGDARPGLIEIELAGGRRVRVDCDVDAAALERVLDVLTRR